MSISSKLTDIKYYYSTHLSFVIETVISTMYFWGYNTKFLEDGSIKAINDKFRRSIYSKTDNKPEKIPTNLSEKINIQINQKPDMIKNHVLKMGLITLFSLFEAFNKDYFQELYCYKPELMKSKKKLIDLEYVLQFDNIEDLHRSLSQRELEKLGHTNIDDLAALFYKKFNIDLRKNLNCWSDLRESYYRRNLIVHADGKVSNTYLEKCSLENVKIGQVLACDIEYVWKCHRNLDFYMDFIDNSIRKKFNLKSHLDSLTS